MATRPKRSGVSKYFVWVPAVILLSGLFLWLAIPASFRSQVQRIVAPGLGESAHASHLPKSIGQETIRRVYPYSVIPGGVQSIKELTDAIGRDPVVAAHYVGFDLTRAQVVRLKQDRTVYVSYRRENQIYWTKRKLKLLRGETIITDGKSAARTRCGNLVSETLVGQASANEPSEKTLDTPQEEASASAPSLMDLTLSTARAKGATSTADPASYPSNMVVPLYAPAGTAIPNITIAQNTSNTSTTSSGQNSPILQPTSNGQGPSGGGAGDPNNGDPRGAIDPSTVVTPEPGTITLVSSGIAALWFARKRRKRSD
jgi:hypothetical protein